jgi:hypothetical protein
MKMLRYLFIAAALVLAAAVAIMLPHLPAIAMKAVAAASGYDVSYTGMKGKGLSSIDLKDLRLVDRKKGLGISAEDAAIRIAWDGLDPRKATLTFDLRKVHFIKEEAPRREPTYDTVDGLVALPFCGGWIYEAISGSVRQSGGAVVIRDFMATSRDLKLSFNGDIGPNNKIRSEIVVYFADSLTSKIPEELTKVVLKNEGAGWKSLSVKLDGDYTMPSIQVTSKLFKLNISVKEQ